jgi:hypothetical protein
MRLGIETLCLTFAAVVDYTVHVDDLDHGRRNFKGGEQSCNERSEKIFFKSSLHVFKIPFTPMSLLFLFSVYGVSKCRYFLLTMSALVLMKLSKNEARVQGEK